ncbi:MAG: MBL fold metallo-hydrolase, partial [Calditrichaeota bacterium]
AAISIPSISPYWMLIYVTLLILFLNWHKRTRRNQLIITVLILVNCLVYKDLLQNTRGLKITFLDVGQGDSALLEFPGGKTMLIDAGDRTEYMDYGQQVILPFLQRRGIRTLDALLLTHPHADHIGGAIALLQNIQVKRIIKTFISGGEPYAAIVDSLVEYRQIPQIHPLSGDTLLIDQEVLLLVMHPSRRFAQPPSIAAELNNSSIVLMCRFYNHAVLFCGDAEIGAEQEMLRFGDLLKCEILKMGHHGSASASSRLFREVTAPKVAVVSVAKRNRFGLPSERLLSDMEKEGIRLLRTSDQGAIVFLLRRGSEKL